MSAAALLLAVALLVAGGRSARRLRELTSPAGARDTPAVLRPFWVAVGAGAGAATGWLLHGGAAGVAVGAGLGLATGIGARRLLESGRAGSDPVDLAAAWDVLAVCLGSGLPVATAVEAAGSLVPGPTGTLLSTVSGRLRLGAHPQQAWEVALDQPALTAFARAACRSASTGAALAAVARTEAARIRAELVDSAQEQAQRAAVRITAPLGLCFLPAFLVLGVAPVVVGLASEALARW